MSGRTKVRAGQRRYSPRHGCVLVYGFGDNGRSPTVVWVGDEDQQKLEFTAEVQKWPLIRRTSVYRTMVPNLTGWSSLS